MCLRWLDVDGRVRPAMESSAASPERHFFVVERIFRVGRGVVAGRLYAARLIQLSKVVNLALEVLLLGGGHS